MTALADVIICVPRPSGWSGCHAEHIRSLPCGCNTTEQKLRRWRVLLIQHRVNRGQHAAPSRKASERVDQFTAALMHIRFACKFSDDSK
jgi:hypothetical protein